MSRINSVAGLVPWREHARAQHPDRAPLFQSEDSMWWFIRHHKPELVRAGALVWISGGWRVDPGAFDAAYVDIVTSEARRAAVARACGDTDEIERPPLREEALFLTRVGHYG